MTSRKTFSRKRQVALSFLVGIFSCIVLLIPSSAYAGIDYNYCGHGITHSAYGWDPPIMYQTEFVRQYGGFCSGTQLMEWHVYHDYKINWVTSVVLINYGTRTKMCPKY